MYYEHITMAKATHIVRFVSHSNDYDDEKILRCIQYSQVNIVT
jgi:hypothetical protein